MKGPSAAVKGSRKLMAGPTWIFLREKGQVLNNLNIYNMLPLVFKNK